MKKKPIWIVLILAAIISIAACSIAKQDINTQNGNKQGTITNIGWFKMYFVPFIPVISVAIVVLGGAWINYCYWKKKEAITKNYKIFEERIKSYLNLCRYLVEFNACTDLIMRADKEVRKLEKKPKKTKEDPSNINSFRQNIVDYEQKRINALTGLREEISYAKIFFKSSKVSNEIKSYLSSYDKIRTRKIKWGPKAFNDLLITGRNLQESMESELKEKIYLS